MRDNVKIQDEVKYPTGSWADQKTLTARCVAGPSPTINYSCNLVPLIVCANDPFADPSVSGSFWGYLDGEIERLKAGTDPGCPPPDPDIGEGNFQLAELGGREWGDLDDPDGIRYQPLATRIAVELTERALIEEAGRRPVERDSLYHPLREYPRG